MASNISSVTSSSENPLPTQIQHLLDQIELSSEQENRMMRALLIATAKMGMMGEDLEKELMAIREQMARYKELTLHLKKLVA